MSFYKGPNLNYSYLFFGTIFEKAETNANIDTAFLFHNMVRTMVRSIEHSDERAILDLFFVILSAATLMEECI